jgi:serine/threonine protein kinase
MQSSFGPYELLERLAGGGMGEVFLARKRGKGGFQKLLVIKTLLPHLGEDEEFILMFKDEARVAARLIHPNICQVFEFDQVGGTWYMAMEYLRGDDLRKLAKVCEAQGVELPPELVCRIVEGAAAGLEFAHSLRDAQGQPYGVVHRDVSPQNIFVTFEGAVKVIDFGVAKAVGRAQHTRTGALKGKYSYMSPEQAAGKSVDNRSDIFALGIVLHELLTKARLFKADSDTETLARVGACVVPVPSALNPRIPPGLDAIVLKALARNPGDRFATAQELRLALEDWLRQGNYSASSAHLAEFLKVIYAERIHKEARTSPMPMEAFDPTQNERSDTRVSRVVARSRGRRAAVAVGMAALIAALAFWAARPQPRAAPVETAPVETAPVEIAPVAVKTAPLLHLVTLQAEPPGTEIREGSQLIGKAPKIWSGAAEGEHELRLSHDGYHDEVAKIVVEKDGQEFSFKLRKLEALKKPELEIKAER